jgi:hypothetical protein
MVGVKHSDVVSYLCTSHRLRPRPIHITMVLPDPHSPESRSPQAIGPSSSTLCLSPSCSESDIMMYDEREKKKKDPRTRTSKGHDVRCKFTRYCQAHERFLGQAAGQHGQSTPAANSHLHDIGSSIITEKDCLLRRNAMWDNKSCTKPPEITMFEGCLRINQHQMLFYSEIHQMAFYYLVFESFL